MGRQQGRAGERQTERIPPDMADELHPEQGATAPGQEEIEIPEREHSNLESIREDLKNPIKRRQALIRLGEWVKDTVLLFGGDPFTAFDVAAIFVQGIEKSYERRDIERAAMQTIRRRERRTS